MRWQLATLVVLAAAVAGAQGPPQTPPPPSGQQTQPPVFRGGTSNVRVDVTVVDHKGNPVTDLKMEDFDVREDGRPQTIDTLKLIEATGAAPDSDMSLPIRSPEHAAAEAARDDIRVFVIFWDEYHIAQMGPSIVAREALTTFVQTAFGPTDLVALVDPLTPADAIRFTRDRRELADAVHQLKGRQGVYLPPRSPMEEAQLYRSRDIEMLRSQVTASALESTIAFLGEIKEGRKSILLVSQTIGRLGTSQSDSYDWLSHTIELANANNTSVYVLDPRGLDMSLRQSDILRALADNTGGRLFAQNAPGPALRQIVRNASAFYLLGYRAVDSPADGKFHKISVHVRRPGVEVTARSGYFAPSLTELENARKKAAEETAPPEIAKALEGIADAPHVPIAGDLWAGATRGPDGLPRVTVAWTSREGAKTGGVVVRANASDGRLLFEGPLTDGSATFMAPPGTLHLRRQIVDADGSLADRDDSTIEVPDFSAALAIATPVLYRASTPLELRSIQSGAAQTPFAGRQFERTDRIFVRFDLFGAAASDATVTATLLSRRGQKLADMPLTKTPGGDYQIDLPIGSVGRGEYVFQIAAARGADEARALLSFRVE